jgi:iron(III) transport system ATP-binding protein
VVCIAGGRILWQGEVGTLYYDPPNEQLARFLGPANWLEPDESDAWLERSEEKPLCLRPEQLTLSPQPESQFVIESARFAGSIAEADVRDTARDVLRTFYHRPAIHRFAPGMNVALRVTLTLLLLLALLVSPGCSRSAGDEPRLQVGEPKHYSLPSEGAMLPAPRGMTFSPEGELFVLDTAGRVLVYGPAGAFARRWWMPKYEIGRPEGAWVLRDGRIAVADTHYHRVLFFDGQGNVLGELGEFGDEDGQFIYTVDVTEDDQAHSVILHFLEKMPGLSAAEVEKRRRKTIDGDNEDFRPQAISCT